VARWPQPVADVDLIFESHLLEIAKSIKG